MKRLLLGGLALTILAITPAASFGRDRDCDRGGRNRQADYQPVYPVQGGYYGGQNAWYSQRNSWQEPSAYDYNGREYNGYNRDAYSNWNRDRAGRSAAYIGGGAAAGAALGAIIGHGKGAAIGALVGGASGYLYQKHNDSNYYGRRY